MKKRRTSVRKRATAPPVDRASNGAARMQDARPQSARYVGIGASAGGLDAIERFFREMPPDSGMAFIVVQHLSPDYKSLMVEIISKYTSMPVLPAADGVEVRPNHVYMMQPRRNLVIVNGRLSLRDKEPGSLLNFPVDIFLKSLAEDQGERAIAIILSGTGRDGVEGVQAIKRVNGLVFAQEESTAQFNGMPKNVIATGCVDYVLPPENIPAALLEHHISLAERADLPLGSEDERVLGRILRLLKTRIGVDYQQYKMATVMRRVNRRMAALRCASLSAYYEQLESKAEEAANLNQELLIGVTRFFRDTEAFKIVAEKAVPEMVRNVPPGETIRVWVCGCSTGEEAYSLGILLLEHLEQYQLTQQIRIFATDVDREAISFASLGQYPPTIADDLSPDRLERYFTRTSAGYTVGRELRRYVTFAVHDVLKDPPFTKLQLVSCRNVLIYLDTIAQNHCLAMFSFALVPEGFLMLGPSETISGLAPNFRSLGGRWKLYRGTAGRERPVLPALLSAAPRTTPPPDLHWHPVPRRSELQSELVGRIERRLVKRFAPAGIVVNDQMLLQYTFGDARSFLQLPEGVVTQEISRLLPKSMQTVLWAGLLRAWRTSKSLRCASPAADGDVMSPLTLTIEPFKDEGGGNYAFVYFESASGEKKRSEPAASKSGTREQIEELQKSLQHAEENLQATVEELETSNEELQATNEELLSSNEELQSTNEELHSMNEELHSVNAQYQEKIQELVVLNNDMSNLFEVTGVGAVFLDRNLTVRKFTPRVCDYIYLMDQDIGRPIEHLANRLYYPELANDLRKVASSGEPLDHHLVTRDGRSVVARVVPYHTDHHEQDGCVLSITDITSLRRAEQRLQVIIDSLAYPLAVIDAAGAIVMRNLIFRLWAKKVDRHPLACEDTESNYFSHLKRSEWLTEADREALCSGIERAASNTEACFARTVVLNGSARRYLVTAMPVLSSPKGAVITVVDLTANLADPEPGEKAQNASAG